MLVAAGLAAAGCGGDEEGKPIPAATASALQTQLDDVQRRIDQGSAGACRDILEAPESRGADRQQVQDLIDSMPDDVDADVRSALQDSFDRLWDLVEQDCEDKDSKKEETNTTPAETETQTTPTETDTTPTETETETTPTSPDEAPLPNDGDGEGGGAVPGAGNGGGVGPGALKEGKKEKEKEK